MNGILGVTSDLLLVAVLAFLHCDLSGPWLLLALMNDALLLWLWRTNRLNT